YQLLQTPLALLFDHLSIDQIGVRYLHGLLRASWLTRARKGLQGMVDLDQSRQITAEAIAEKAGDTPDDDSRHLDELQGSVKRPWADKRRKDESKLGGETDPYPLPPVLTPVGAFPVRAGLLRVFASDEAPHLIELHVRHGQVSRSRCGLISWAFFAAVPSQARTVSSVTPKTKPMSDKATLTSSIVSAIMTLSSGVLRSKKTVSRVSEKVPSHLPQ